ncbi:unnamed protein product [Cyprideis torosa]|uniref:Uncharacterized protein n=1 Tax=Cyprideis torosa TaxID=163714 RepID=A0A7R8W5J3_9CRUS|nr:unnamed protein product [Cyprideis torosa]CAG0882933.1 unnamed protein product [Cyprideis torosa]
MVAHQPGRSIPLKLLLDQVGHMYHKKALTKDKLTRDATGNELEGCGDPSLESSRASKSSSPDPVLSEPPEEWPLLPTELPCRRPKEVPEFELERPRDFGFQNA